MFPGCCLLHLIGLCLTYALAISAKQPARCSLGVDEGHCEEEFLRWFYNSRTGHCETFVYSGCGGNANNFNATMYCLLACNGTEADTHAYSIASDQTDQLKTGEKKDPKVIRSKRSNDHEKTNSKVRTTNSKGLKSNSSNDASDIQEILSQLSRSVNLLERIVNDNVGKTPRKPPGKKSPGNKHRRQKSPTPAASIDILASKQSTASEEEGKEKSLKTMEVNHHAEQSKTNDLEDDETDFNAEERNMLDVKIKSIISDPSFVFSYRNISARDMSVLKEVVFGMDTKALRLVTPSSQAGDNGGIADAGPRETTVLQVTEAGETNQATGEQPPVNGI